MVAQHDRLNMQQAFSRLRAYARDNNLRLADVARDIIDGKLTTTAFDRPM
jgi:hypothetical protein